MQPGDETLHVATGIPGTVWKASSTAAFLLCESRLPESCSEDWNAQIHCREDGLEGKIPKGVRGPDKHEHRSFCNGSPHYCYRNLTLAPDKKNGSAEDFRTHRVLQNAAIMLADIPEIGRLRVLLHFVGQILTLAPSCDHGHSFQVKPWVVSSKGGSHRCCISRICTA